MLLDDFAILSLDAGGDTLQNMLEQSEFVEAIKTTGASIMLFSGGGNDLLAGGHLAEHLRDHDAALSAYQHLLPSFERVLGDAIGWYDKLFRKVEAETPGVALIVHGYDRPIPAAGRWLRAPMSSHDIPEDVQLQIAAVMIDRFNERLKLLAEGFEHMTPLDNRGTLGAGRWYDELHPTEPGYAEIAGRFKAAIGIAARRIPTQARERAKPVKTVRREAASTVRQRRAKVAPPPKVSGRTAAYRAEPRRPDPLRRLGGTTAELRIRRL